eukprot:3853173-Pyramimonas_sp.AAC.1
MLTEGVPKLQCLDAATATKESLGGKTPISDAARDHPDWKQKCEANGLDAATATRGSLAGKISSKNSATVR